MLTLFLASTRLSCSFCFDCLSCREEERRQKVWIWLIFHHILVVNMLPSPQWKTVKYYWINNYMKNKLRKIYFRKIPGTGNGCPLQYSCLENSMDRGALWATVHGFGKSWTQLNNWYFDFQRGKKRRMVKRSLDMQKVMFLVSLISSLNKQLHNFTFQASPRIKFPCSPVYIPLKFHPSYKQNTNLQSTRLLHPWNSPGKNTGVGCHFLLQGIFLTQGSNPGLPHCRQTL